MLAPGTWLVPDGQPVDLPQMQLINRSIRAALEGRRNIHLVEIADFVEPGKLRDDPLHFDRLTYKRLADHAREVILANALQGPGAEGRTPPTPSAERRVGGLWSKLRAWSRRSQRQPEPAE